MEPENARLVNSLFVDGVDANKGEGVDGMEPINIACRVRRTNIMITLLGRGADIDLRD